MNDDIEPDVRRLMHMRERLDARDQRGRMLPTHVVLDKEAWQIWYSAPSEIWDVASRRWNEEE